MRQSSIAYTKVTDRHGKVLLKSKSKKKKVMDEGVAFIMTDMLRTVVSNGIAGAASISGVQAGGKTGTTNSNYDIWFDGFTPNYAASLWIGTDVNIKLSSMSGMAARLWGRIMNQVPNAKNGKYKSMPNDVVKVGSEYYTKGTEKGRSSYVQPKPTPQQNQYEENDDTDDDTSQSTTNTNSGPTIPGA